MLVPKMRPSALSTCTRTLRPLKSPSTKFFLPRCHRAFESTSPPPQTHITTLPGVTLDSHQSTLIRSLLALFSGHPSLPHLSHWSDSATFSNPLITATGRAKYSAQWYALAKAFSNIDVINHQVRDAGNPMRMDLRVNYTLRGLGTQQLVQSEVGVWVDGEGKVERVEDRWDGELGEGVLGNAFRQLSGAAVPAMVSVPKTEEEDAKR